MDTAGFVGLGVMGAPVLSGEAGARAGTLSIMVGGPKPARASCPCYRCWE